MVDAIGILSCVALLSKGMGRFSCNITWAQGYKTFFMFNSAENEICSAYKKSNTINLNFLPAQQN